MNSRWLYYQVHGVFPPRKVPRKRTGRGPKRDWRYRQWIRSLPCCACGSQANVEAHHAGKDGGMGQRASDYSCVPCCTDCHTLGPDAYHRIGREEFERRHGLDLGDLVGRLNRAWFAYGNLVK